MSKYEDLHVWQKAHQLTLEVYRLTALFPSTEKYGLVPQLRRATSSIAMNISEGCGRISPKELRHFLSIARGSVSEAKYELLLAKDLSYV